MTTAAPTVDEVLATIDARIAALANTTTTASLELAQAIETLAYARAAYQWPQRAAENPRHPAPQS